MPTVNHLFRFVSVHPAETAAGDRELFGFLRLPGDGAPATHLQRSVFAADTRSEAVAAAREFIRSDRYLRGFDRSAPVQRHLADFYDLASRAPRREAFDELVRRLTEFVQQGPWDDLPEALTALHHQFWDSLISAFLSPRTEPHDRRGQAVALRTFHVIDVLGRLRSRADLFRALAATPLVPAWARKGRTRSPGQQAPPEPQPPEPQPPEPQPGPLPVPAPGGLIPASAPERLAWINTLRRRLHAIRSARREVDAAYWAASRDLVAAQAATPPPDPSTEPPWTPSTGPARAPSTEAEAGTPTPRWTGAVQAGMPPWRTSQRVAERVQPHTAALLSELDPHWTVAGYHAVVEAIDRAHAATYQELVRAGGTRAVRGVEHRVDLTLEDLGQALPAPERAPVAMEPSVGSVKPAGVGDLLLVQERLVRYEETDVAYIENVMMSESRQRVHRRLDREVETVATTVEESEATERDLQTSEQYQLNTEVERTLETDQSLHAGVSTSASYGPVVSVDASADFSVDNATSTATRSSSSYAQDIVDRSVSRVAKKITERIVHKTLSEVEETNTHGFDNTDGTGHVVGIYRWLDQVLEAQIYHYGKRLFMEFVVPEPAAFYRHAQAQLVTSGTTMTPPEPLEDDFSFLDLTEGTYQTWVDRYRVPDVSPPPPKYQTATAVVEIPELFHDPKDNDYVLMTKKETLVVPEGYEALEAWVHTSLAARDKPFFYLHVLVGQQTFVRDPVVTFSYFPLDREVGVLPVGVICYEGLAAVVSVEVRCERQSATLLQWQLETYQKIVDAYQSQQAAYDAHLANLRNLQSAGLNDLHPDKKRQIERDELQKGALLLLTDQDFESFDAMQPDAPPHGYPELDVAEAMAEGSYAQFMQQCFEWHNAVFTYYPYIWGRKSGWVETSSLTDTDLQFEAFLKAGAARVLVPVRPTYEKSLLYYLTTAEIWNGGEAPVIDDPNYVAIVDEIAESQTVSLEDGVPYGDPWTYSLPTELVKLQEGPELPSWESPPPDPADPVPADPDPADPDPAG